MIFQSIASGLLGVIGAHALSLAELDKGRNQDRLRLMPKMGEYHARDLIRK